MANENTGSTTPEPRALGAALAAPAMVTRMGGMAMHAADRHVERWAPETTANQSRPLRNLGFVDRMIAPWIETAQRSASLRLFSQYRADGMNERAPSNVSWVFPRPWYQDELDWMAAARQNAGTEAATMFTTRGTYVEPVRQQQPSALPAALYEFVAPSLSITQTAQPAGVGYGGSDATRDAYSPLVPLAAVHAAEVMSRAVAPMASTGGMPSRVTPALRSVLSAMLERSTAPRDATPSRLSMQAPELVTPPAPRAPAPAVEDREATQLAERYAEQRVHVAEVQRVARQAAERELATRIEAARAQVTTQSTASATAVAPELRDASTRSEAEVRQRAHAEARTADAARTEAVREQQIRSEAQSEQARSEQARGEQVRGEQAQARSELARSEQTRSEQTRIEERVAQRLAERTGAQRLHDQSRVEAAQHARSEPTPATITPAISTAPTMPMMTRAPAEVTAAIAALPPELAAWIGQRPERAMQTIDELGETLRNVELLTRGAATNTALEITRGPRLMMPAGLGGLVAAIDHAQLIDRPTGVFGPQVAAHRPAQAQARPIPVQRMPAMSWLSAPSTRLAAPTNALDATAATSPAALSHVAWADRWLARFAGASQHSLDTLSAAATPSMGHRMEMLAASAPGSVFVSPTFDIERAGEVVRFDDAGRALVSAPSSRDLPPVAASPQPASAPAAADTVIRYADDAETPDDVFAAISQGATAKRVAASPQGQASSAAAAASAATPSYERFTAADMVAHAAPNAPGAGFAAQLASSPFAPALRHVLPLPSAASFDVRALFGGGLSATFLAGLLGMSSDEVETGAQTLPSWATWGEAPELATAREIPSFDPTYVSPEMPAPIADDLATEPSVGALAPQLAAVSEPLTTLRTALLSWNVESTQAGAQFAPAHEGAPTVISTSTASPVATSTARTMLEAMSLPMFGDVAPPATGESWTSPGSIAERAHAWSVAQERSSADLAFDFVSPELVLAARVYGLGPAEAAQASRLALAGPGQLTAMAGTVDRTFVQALAIDADRRAAAPRETLASAYPTRTGELVATTGPVPTSSTTPSRSPIGDDHAPTYGTSFGVERRMPRGAFLWPSGTVAALGLSASAPDSEQSMSVAALELLAAQSVAELGTFAAFGDHPVADQVSEPGAITSHSAQSTSGALPERGIAAEPSESDVLGAATAMVSSARRARFDALYVALSQSPGSSTWSPAARAARALALAGRGEAGGSARERAAFAWDVLPVVYADALAAETTSASSSASSSVVASDGRSPHERQARAHMTSLAGRGAGATGPDPDDSFTHIDGRPGLGALSSRAGEALGSYVVAPDGAATSAATSASSSVSSASAPREVGAVLRAPTAAQELVRTGRPSGRHGGGETEIPAWFESAARKMLEDRSGASDGISLAELTLVTAAPPSHVAASSRTSPGAGPTNPGANTQASPALAGAANIDVEKIANDIYRHILNLMDVARARNGEPYL